MYLPPAQYRPPRNPASAGILLALPHGSEPLRQALLEHGYNPYQVHVTSDIVGVYTMGMAMRLSHAVIDVACEGWERPVISALRNQGIRGVLLAPADFPADSVEGWPVLPYGSHESVIISSLLGTMPDDDPTARPAGKLIAVAGTHGAPGRTTLAWALSRTVAQAESVVLIDGDVEAPSLAAVSGVGGDPAGLSAAVALASRGQMNQGQELLPFLRRLAGNLDLLAGVSRPGRWWELPPASLTAVWSAARELAPWTLLDLAPLDQSEDIDPFEPSRSSYTGALLAEADGLIVVARPGEVGLERLRRLLDELRVGPADGIPKIVVINNVPRNRMELMRIRRLVDGLPSHIQLTVVPSFPNPLPQRSMAEPAAVCDWMLSRRFLEPVVTWMRRLGLHMLEGGSAVFSADAELMTLVGEEPATQRFDRPVISLPPDRPLTPASPDSSSSLDIRSKSGTPLSPIGPQSPPTSDTPDSSTTLDRAVNSDSPLTLDSSAHMHLCSPSSDADSGASLVSGEPSLPDDPVSPPSAATPASAAPSSEGSSSLPSDPATGSASSMGCASTTPILRPLSLDGLSLDVHGSIELEPAADLSKESASPSHKRSDAISGLSGSLPPASSGNPDAERVDTPPLGPPPPPPPPPLPGDGGRRDTRGPQGQGIAAASDSVAGQAAEPLSGSGAGTPAASAAPVLAPPVAPESTRTAAHTAVPPLGPPRRRGRNAARHRAEPTPLWQRLRGTPKKRGRHRA